MTARLITVGAILGAHGIKGEVKLRSFTADPAAIAGYGPFTSPRGETFELLRLRAAADDFIAAFKGVTDRNRAETLRGVELQVPRGRLPAPEDGQSYIADLIGMTVELAGNVVLGVIENVVNYGASDLLEVRVPGRRDTVLIPYAERYISAEADGVITADLPDGFLDPEPAGK